MKARVCFLSLLMGAMSLLLASCQMDNSRTAPQITALLPAARGSASTVTLDAGRQVFVTRCVECHLLQPIAKHSETGWHEIIAIMAPRAKLTPTERIALEAYLSAAKRSLKE